MKKDDVKSLLLMVLLIVFVRSFIVEPFKIPSGSMIPTFLIGDHLFVSKSSYDIGIPFTNVKLIHVSDPKRGDVVVFEYPNPEKDPDKDGIYYIKRLIGVPGDVISVTDGIPTLNGKVVDQQALLEEPRIPGFALNSNNRLLRETLPGMDHWHWVQRYPYRTTDLPAAAAHLKDQTGRDCIEIGKAALQLVPDFQPVLLNNTCTFTVPAGQYFAMGDNRDDSADSREWGFVERRLLKGRALFIWISWLGLDPRVDPHEGGPFLRWTRLGQSIK